MSGLVLAVATGRAAQLGEQLARAGFTPMATVAPHAPAGGEIAALLDAAQTLVLDCQPETLTADLVADCDRAGVRIIPLCATDPDRRLAQSFGAGPILPADCDGWDVADALSASLPSPSIGEARTGRVVVVWGPEGAPGRSTLARELAATLAGTRRRVCLVDADSHAPSLALMLGLADEGPGFAAACRRAERGTLDGEELSRISTSYSVAGGNLDVLPGLNRSSRWPELSEGRVAAALQAMRAWAEVTVVDVAASLERDEEIVSDLVDGPRRNAATLAALREADRIVAVTSADPVGIARFLRAHAELRATVGHTPVSVVANRQRSGALGIDAHGQVRRALERFAGVREVAFVPEDRRSADTALLTARPICEASPRSALSAAVRRLVHREILPLAERHTRPRRRLRAAV